MNDDPLANIERSLRALGRSACLQMLRPGLTPERVTSTLADLNLPTSEDVVTLYGWHDGVDAFSASTLDELHLFPGFYMLSLGDAAANYRGFVADPRWWHGWLPIFANGGGDFYVTDLVNDPRGSIRHFRIEEREHPVEFESLPAMLRTLAASFDDGVFFVDDHGYLEMDDHAFETIAARMNPTVSWWRD